MAAARLCSAIVAQRSIRVCRALYLASARPVSPSFLRSQPSPELFLSGLLWYSKQRSNGRLSYLLMAPRRSFCDAAVELSAPIPQEELEEASKKKEDREEEDVGVQDAQLDKAEVVAEKAASKPSCQVDNVEIDAPPKPDELQHPWKEWHDFVDFLHRENYVKDVTKEAVDSSNEPLDSSRYIKQAILDFSRDRDDVIRFLTKFHIRVISKIGCPSIDRKVVNASKRLRVLCEIPEDEVCQQCKLKTFCTRAFVEPAPKISAETVDVTRVLYAFVLNASPNAESQVSYPTAVTKSACHLLGELVQLGAYPKDPSRVPKRLSPASKSLKKAEQLQASKSSLDRKEAGESASEELVDDVQESSKSERKCGADWTCPKCQFKNFRRNTKCHKCSAKRTGPMELHLEELQPGDWRCPECSFRNFRRNDKCRECNAECPNDVDKEAMSIEEKLEDLEPGDWRCPECNFRNFRRNKTCRECNTACPTDTVSLRKSTEGKLDDLQPGDWRCPKCNFRNFKRNNKCRDCGASKSHETNDDDRWGLKKASERSLGSANNLASSSTRPKNGRTKHQEWKPDLKRRMFEDTDDDKSEEDTLSDDMDAPVALSKSRRIHKSKDDISNGEVSVPVSSIKFSRVTSKSAGTPTAQVHKSRTPKAQGDKTRLPNFVNKDVESELDEEHDTGVGRKTFRYGKWGGSAEELIDDLDDDDDTGVGRKTFRYGKWGGSAEEFIDDSDDDDDYEDDDEGEFEDDEDEGEFADDDELDNCNEAEKGYDPVVMKKRGATKHSTSVAKGNCGHNMSKSASSGKGEGKVKGSGYRGRGGQRKEQTANVEKQLPARSSRKVFSASSKEQTTKMENEFPAKSPKKISYASIKAKVNVKEFAGYSRGSDDSRWKGSSAGQENEKSWNNKAERSSRKTAPNTRSKAGGEVKRKKKD